MTRHRVLFFSAVVVLFVVVVLSFVYVVKREVPTPVVTPEPAVPSQETERSGENTDTPFRVNGTIESISGSTFVLRVQTLDDTGATSSEERSVTVGDDTIIATLSVSDSARARREMEEFQVEMEEYMATLKKFQDENGADAELPENLIPPALPMLATEREVRTAETLEVGQSVSVTGVAEARELSSFTAQTIEVSPLPGPGAEPAVVE